MNSCTTSKATRLRSLSISISNRGFHRVQTCFLQPTRRDNQNPGRNAAAEQSTSQRLEQCHPTAVTVFPLYSPNASSSLSDVGCAGGTVASRTSFNSMCLRILNQQR